ncbi:hypothetical protein CBR_g37032 [Chara braunii]|uniref:Uncharacterized protein n=1 Tax=Chara braunii TaxID=69332 RepID=A0A388LLW8_CHABU|nr:hypothetical protein CBR_g37032 [Chara braunii]|eukprot:GBG83320.1 hypothetical protein CBR_g37032 [Chara braunii]
MLSTPWSTSQTMCGVQQSRSDAAHPFALPRSFPYSGHDNTSAVPVAGVFASDPVHRTEETRSLIEAVQPASCTPVSTNHARDVLSLSNDSEARMSLSPRSPRTRSNTPREGKPCWVRCRLDQQNRLGEIGKAMRKELSTRIRGSKDKKKNHCSYEDVFDQLLEWSSVHIDKLMSKYGPGEQSSGHGGSCEQGSDASATPKPIGGRPRSDALKWRDGKPGYSDNGPMFERLTVRDQMAMWDTKARPDVVFIEPVKLLQILGMFEQTCPEHGKKVEMTITKIHYPCHICKLQFECGKGCTWHWSSVKVVSPGGVRNSRVKTQFFHSTLTAGMTYTQLNNLLRGLGMKKVRKETFYNFFCEDGPGSRQWLRHVERVTQKSFDKIIARLRRSNDPLVVLVDRRYDSSCDAQHCTVTAVDLKSEMIAGAETMLRGSESSWKLETQCVEKLLHRLKDEKNLIIAVVMHDDCGAVDVILRRMNIESQKCMWHKAKTLVKCLREAVRGTKTVEPVVVGACEHVREVKYFTKKELEL